MNKCGFHTNPPLTQCPNDLMVGWCGIFLNVEIKPHIQGSKTLDLLRQPTLQKFLWFIEEYTFMINVFPLPGICRPQGEPLVV